MLKQESRSVMPLLQIEDVRAYYPVKKGVFSHTVGYVKAVDGVSIDIIPGETLGLVGESGCGKSTLGRTILNLDEDTLTKGSIRFSNREITGMKGKHASLIRQKIQMIFQDPYSSLPPRKRVMDIIAEPVRVHNLCPRDKIDDRVEELLEAVGLFRSHKHRYPHEFSGGQRQRIGIARALAVNPQLIICDEPVSALDVSIQAQMLNLLKDLQDEFKLTYLFISHGLGAVKYISDRIAVMYLGKIVELAPTQDIFASPRHPYTRALLSAYPAPDPHLRNREKMILQGDVPSPLNPPSGCRFASRCPEAREACRQSDPQLSGENHRVACFYAD